MNIFYYIKNYSYNALPTVFFRWNYKRLKHFEENCDKQELENRINYYFKVNRYFNIPEMAIAVKDFKKTKGTGYYLDLKEFSHYFSADTRFAYQLGDDTNVNPFPTLFKARPINGDNANSILFKLNKRRHFKWVDDPHTFIEKKNMLVWRGGVFHDLRKRFVRNFWNHTLCNVGQTNKKRENVPWQKECLSIKEHLKYKFIFCPEGNDVATNLKWVMSSNSLCMMPKPTCETWFMEGSLKAGIHYVEINNKFSDLEAKILYYTSHTTEAEKIINNAHQYIKQFRDNDFEDLLCLKILERYAELSGQSTNFRFK